MNARAWGLHVNVGTTWASLWAVRLVHCSKGMHMRGLCKHYCPVKGVRGAAAAVAKTGHIKGMHVMGRGMLASAGAV